VELRFGRRNGLRLVVGDAGVEIGEHLLAGLCRGLRGTGLCGQALAEGLGAECETAPRSTPGRRSRSCSAASTRTRVRWRFQESGSTCPSSRALALVVSSTRGQKWPIPLVGRVVEGDPVG
jgi:hypothetical protein